MEKITNAFKKIFKYIKIVAVLGFVLIEEIVWDNIGLPAYNAVQSLKIMDRFETWIADIEHRYTLLGIFITPFIAMEVASLLSVKAFATGAIIVGIGLYTIKIILTVPVVIIFKSGKSTLVTFWVVRYSYGVILNFKRSKTFRRVMKYIDKVKDEFQTFKANYLNGDGSFKDEIKKIYANLKKIKSEV